MKAKIFGISMLALLMVSLFAVGAVALDLPKSVDINGKTAEDHMNIERSESIDIEVQLKQLTVDAENVRLYAEIESHDSDDVITDRTSIFDMKAGSIYTKSLTLDLPADMKEGSYTLRLELTDKDSQVEDEYVLDIGTTRRKLVIDDISMDDKVKAGSSMYVKVRVANMGQFDEKDVKVTVEADGIDFIGNKDDYIDEIEADDEEPSQAIYLKVPSCQKAQEYEVTVKAENKYAKASETVTLEVVEGDTCGVAMPNAFVTEGVTAQSVEAGKAAIFKLQVSNAGSASQAFTVEVDGAANFADVEVYPGSAMVVEGGQSEDVFVYVYADEDASGNNPFSVTVKAGDKVVDTVDMTASVEAGSKGWDGVKKALVSILIVIVVLLIILGLIIGFNKMKGDDEEGEESQTYY